MSTALGSILVVALVFLVDVEGKPQNMNEDYSRVLRNINTIHKHGIVAAKLTGDDQARQKKSLDTLMCNTCRGNEFYCEYEEKECAPGQVCGSVWDNDNRFSFTGCMEPQLCDLIQQTGVTSVTCCESDLCNWKF